MLNDEIADVDLKVNSARDRAAALNGLKCADLVDAVGRSTGIVATCLTW